MPTYVWNCKQGHEWDVVTTIAERDNPSSCPECQGEGTRGLTLPQIDKTAASDWNNISYNPGLGCWTKGTSHARRIAKERGLIEVGNESPEKIHKANDQYRKETRERRWQDADREKVYD